jgi:CDP-paratose 2-epimerase
MKRIIITGGAGFMGVNFANYYLNKGYSVLVFDNLSRKGGFENLEWLKKNPNARNLDIMVGDVRFPTKALAGKVESSDAIFHFAAQVAVTTSVTEPGHDFDVNAKGTFNMLELVRNSRGNKPVFFYASTNKVYGGMEDVQIIEDKDRYWYKDFPDGIPEDRSLDFHSPYGCSKGCADQYVRDYARIYGLRTVVFRQSCIYGYRQFGIEDQGWVAWFLIATILERPITIYGNGKQVRDVLFIDDLIRAYDMAWDNISSVSGKVYNIGGGPGNAISLHDLVSYLRKEVNPSLSVSYSDWRPGDQPIYISDITRSKQDFGWQPEVSWNSGVKDLLSWVITNKEMLHKVLHD